MPVDGAIADAARGHLPLTWDALRVDPAFGDALLQQAVDTVREELFGVVTDEATDEEQPLIVLRYAGKMVAVELVSPGIDLWMNQPSAESATGTNEQHTFVDRAERLRVLGERLRADLLRDQASIFALLGRAPSRALPRPNISTDPADVLLTPDPRTFPAPFRTGVTTQRTT